MSEMSKVKKINNLVIIVILIIFIAGIIFLFGTANPPASSNFKIISTIYIIDQYVEALTDNSISSELLIPNNVEPHEYSPTPSDIVKLQNADLIIINGIIDSWIYNYPIDQDKILDLSKTLPSSMIMNKYDPHYWLSLEISKEIEKIIFARLYDSLPDKQSILSENLEAVLSKLDLYILRFEEVISICPAYSITYHEAYNYFNDEFDIHSLAITGVNPEAEPSAGKLAELVGFIRDHQIKFLLIDPIEKTTAAENLANIYDLDILSFHTLEGTTDNKSIFELLEINLLNLEIALTCNQI